MILIDYREKESGIPKLLIKKNIPINFENLKIGDYIIGDIVIERKTSKDFVASIFDGRIFEQASKIIYSNDIEETSNILEIIHKHGKYEKINKAFIKPKKKADSISEQQLNIIASIPYIGEKYAERLLKNLKTIKNVVNASPQTLSLLANIPPKNAHKIWLILNKEYKK
ncbi:MAG: ERCC4 domain-containing protein [Nitrososphaerota archaeon]